MRYLDSLLLGTSVGFVATTTGITVAARHYRDDRFEPAMRVWRQLFARLTPFGRREYAE